MNADGSDQTDISNNPAWDGNGAYSPDGTKIAFSSQRAGGTPQIYTMNADGSNVTRLTNDAFTDNRPAWSPDGSKIVYTSTASGNQQLYIMNADGSNQTRLTNNANTDGSPEWSTDGSKIVYYESTGVNKNSIFTMNADGSNQTNLTGTSVNYENPVYSPSGNTIMFQGYTGTAWQIYTMNADGTNQQQITTTAPGVSNFANGYQFYSPDGSKVVFTSTRDGNYEIYTMNPDGSDQTRLTDNNYTDVSTGWQPLTIPPTLGNDIASVTSGKSVNVNVLANDSSVYSPIDPPTVKLASQPSKGTASVNPDGSITYTANNNATGTDSFTYQACASINDQLCSTATISVTIAPSAPATGFTLASAHPWQTLAAALATVTALFALAQQFRKSASSR